VRITPDLQTPYAISKYVGGLYCELFSRLYGVPTVRLRYFVVYGDRELGSGPYGVLSGIFAERAAAHLPLEVHGDGSKFRDFVEVRDVAKANWLAMLKPSLVDATINVGTGAAVTIQQLADAISENQVHTEARKVDLQGTLADTSRSSELLGWVPEKSILHDIAYRRARHA